MSEIKAIETVYNGYKFRSRLEARWAVFFDAAGIKYEYEPQGFELSDGTKYLPDFYLPEYDWFVEVKPNRPGAVDDLKRIFEFVRQGMNTTVILGNIPDKTHVDLYHYSVIYYNKLRRDAHIERIAIRYAKRNPDDKNYCAKFDSYRVDSKYLLDSFDMRYAPDEDLTDVFEAIHDRKMYKVFFGYENGWSWSDCCDNEYDINGALFLNSCYDAARQARFEHGQTPKPNVSINQPTKVEINNTETTVKRKYRKVMNEFKPKNEYELDAIRKYSIAIDQIVKVSPSIRHMLQRGIVCDIKHDISNKSCLICIGYGRGEIIVIKLLEGRKNQIEETLTKVFNEKVYIEFVELESGESA